MQSFVDIALTPNQLTPISLLEFANLTQEAGREYNYSWIAYGELFLYICAEI